MNTGFSGGSVVKNLPANAGDARDKHSQKTHKAVYDIQRACLKKVLDSRESPVILVFIAKFFHQIFSALIHSFIPYLFILCVIKQTCFQCAFDLIHYLWGASQVVQWWRTRLPMQETQEKQVWSMGQEDPLE